MFKNIIILVFEMEITVLKQKFDFIFFYFNSFEELKY